MSALEKCAEKGRWRASPEWYGAETSHYLKGGRGIYHGIRIRKDGKRPLLSRLLNPSSRSIPKSQAAEVRRRLSKIKGVDVLPDGTGGERPGAEVAFGHKGYLSNSMRNKIDAAIYGFAKKGSVMNALEKYATKKKSLPSLPYGARVPKSLSHKLKSEQKPPVVVPITDPNDGRIFSHRERELQQSLPKKLRGPSWKDTSHPTEMPGMPKGPNLKQPRDKDYWKGAPLTHPRSVNIKQLNKQGSAMSALEKYAAKQVLIEKLAAWPAIARGAAALGRGAGRLIKSHKDARAIRQAQMGAAKVLKGGYARRAPDISTVSNLIKNPMHPEAQKLIQESVRRASPKTGLVRSTLNLPKNVRSLARAPGDLKKLLRNYPTVTNKHIGTLGGPVNTKAAVMKMKQQLKAGKPAGANIALGKTPLSVRLGPASAQQSQAVRGATRAAAKRDIANVGRGLAIPGAGYGAYKARVK